jgi:hypothetical protein
MEKRKPSRQRRGGEGAFGEGGTRRVPEKKGGDEFRLAFQPRLNAIPKAVDVTQDQGCCSPNARIGLATPSIHASPGQT